MRTYKKILIICVIIILIILLGLSGILISKHVIIQDIKKKLSESQKNNNYYVKMIIDEDSYEEYFQKDDNCLLRKEILSNQKWEEYKNNDNINLYIDAYSYNKKVCDLNRNVEMEKIELENCFIEQTNYLKLFEYIKFLLNIKIEKRNDCYLIKENNKVSDYIVDKNMGEDNKTNKSYSCDLSVNKDTGLIESLKIYEKEKNIIELNYSYKFDYVTDEMLKEPDVNEYEIK